MKHQTPVRVAVIDMYNRTANRGLGNIINLLEKTSTHWPLEYRVFETRYLADVPDLSYDIFISSGGPGDPFDGQGTRWEKRYFQLLETIWEHNQQETAHLRKHMLFICHSFQLMARFFELGQVTRRRSRSFGVFPVHKTEAGHTDPLLDTLGDPFYAADFRHWQVIQPNRQRMEELGARILALEKIRPHVNLERAVMAIRLSEELVGTQFHPEADPENMLHHFTQEAQRKQIIEEHGKEKYERIIHRMKNPAYLYQTFQKVLPTFLKRAIKQLREGEHDNERMVA